MIKKTIIVLDYSTGKVSFIDAVYNPKNENIEDIIFSEKSRLNETNCNWMVCDINQIKQSLKKCM